MSSAERAAELVPLIKNEPPEIFWPIFLRNWPHCDAAWESQQLLVPILRRVGPCPREIYAEHAEHGGRFWSALPDDLTLYRGCSRSHVEAISWTTNRSVAEDFARGHRGIAVPDPVIVAATVARKHVFAVIYNRSEAEVLLDPAFLKITAIAPLAPVDRLPLADA